MDKMTDKALAAHKTAKRQNGPAIARPSREQAEEAVRTLHPLGRRRSRARGAARHAGPRRARPTRSSSRGYDHDPVAILKRTFEETDGYDEMIVLRDMRFESHCEHHLAPIIGRAHIAYLPNTAWSASASWRGCSTAYAKRLQIQEKMTAQIANTMHEVLQPRGVAVVIDASHQCMTTRGVHKPGISMVTSRMLGAFRTDPSTRREFLAIIGNPSVGQLPNV